VIVQLKIFYFVVQLLDDNRELRIPETQQVVQAKEEFVLFATQNPPGHYGGRKVCSSNLMLEFQMSFNIENTCLWFIEALKQKTQSDSLVNRKHVMMV